MAFISSRVIQILLSLAILTVLLVYLISGTPDLIGSQTSQSNTVADTYLLEGKSWQYNPRGELNHLLRVDSLYHFKTTALSKLEKPVLQVYKEAQLTWTANATKGNIEHGAQTIELNDSVILNNDQQNIRLTTSAMTVTPAKKIAQSKQHTTIVNSDSQIEAQSMHADLSSDIVTMKTRVKGYYAQP